MSFGTFGRYVNEWLVEQGDRIGGGARCHLKGYGTDHNCCHICRDLFLNVTTAREQVAAATQWSGYVSVGSVLTLAGAAEREKAGDAGVVVAAWLSQRTAALAAAEAAFKAHTDLDVQQRKKMNEMTGCGQRLANVECVRRRDDEPADYVPPVGAYDGVMVGHGDEAAKKNVPSPNYEGAEGLEKFRCSVNGVYWMTTDTFSLGLPEQGAQSKDSSFVIEMFLLALIMNLSGEKVVVLTMDCARVNNSSLVAVFLPWLVVNLGLAETCVVLFHQKYHSKSWSDKVRAVGHARLQINRC
jgi:hypothetical protein